MKTNGRVVVVEPLPPRARRQKGGDKFTLRYSTKLTRALIERCRDAVDARSGPPPHGERMTLTKFAGEALEAYLKRFENKHNGGQPFPRRDAPLKHARTH